jgi:hypothetical protein
LNTFAWYQPGCGLNYAWQIVNSKETIRLREGLGKFFGIPLG